MSGADGYEWDVAVSFAGEDRPLVRDVVRRLQDAGVRVFYDYDHVSTLWGENLVDLLHAIYSKQARYALLFISQHYVAKNWSTHERHSAQERAFTQRSPYILPVRVDDTDIPGMPSTVGYLDARRHGPAGIARAVLDKLASIDTTGYVGGVPDGSGDVAALVTARPSLNGKVAVVTGGSSGIGLATAKRFVEEGAAVFIMGRRQTELDKAVAEIGGDVTAVRGDVSNVNDLDRLYEHVRVGKGKLDIVFANAAIIELAPIGQITEDSFERVYNVNVKGLIFTVQQALPLLVPGASVILTGSGGSYKGLPLQSVYTSSKAAVRTLARSWIVELKERQIRVNVVTPGAFATPGIDAITAERPELGQLFDQMPQLVPAGRIGEPEELANVVAFLASAAASYVNGADFQVDGGFTQI